MLGPSLVAPLTQVALKLLRVLELQVSGCLSLRRNLEDQDTRQQQLRLTVPHYSSTNLLRLGSTDP